MKKIGFIGNSCTGKTTAAFSLIAHLKMERALVGYVTDMARGIPFAPSKLDEKPEARLHVLFNQMKQETAQACRDDVDYLVTERTAMDWYIYYVWTCQRQSIRPSAAVARLVEEWERTYDLIVFLDDREMVYIDDGYRPATTKIRDEVSPAYARLAADLIERRNGTDHSVVVIDGATLEGRQQLAQATVGAWFREKGGIFVRPSRARR